MSALRKWLFTGLLVIVPGVITAWVLHWIISTLDQTLQILPENWQPDRLLGFHIPGFGVLLTFAILLTVGALASNFAGRKLVEWGDRLVSRIPVVRSIYSSVKQVSDTLFSESGNAFRTAVLVQWPREGVWTVAFITGAPSGEVAAYLRDGYVSVYVPTTPNPTGGYFVILRKSDCIELDMSVDAALKYIVSMGVVAPRTSRSPIPSNPFPSARPARAPDTSPPVWAPPRAGRSTHGHAFPLLRSRHRSPDGPNRHPRGLGEPPPRPWRRDLHRPARPRRQRAGGVRPGPRRHVQDGRGRAQRVLRAGQGPGARAPPGARPTTASRAAGSRCCATS